MPTTTLAWQTNPHTFVKGSIARVPNIMTICGKGSSTRLIVSAQWILQATRRLPGQWHWWLLFVKRAFAWIITKSDFSKQSSDQTTITDAHESGNGPA